MQRLDSVQLNGNIRCQMQVYKSTVELGFFIHSSRLLITFSESLTIGYNRFILTHAKTQMKLNANKK